MAKKISESIWEDVVQAYIDTGSILDTAAKCKVSTVKVRKILITEGLWSSKTSEQIDELLKNGFNSAQVAEKLCMSIKNVQAYMPYERGVYDEDRSVDAVRSGRYRDRMKVAAGMQKVSNAEEFSSERKLKMITNNKNLGAMLLHLELRYDWFTEEDKLILKKYGDVSESISRDIIVPSDITLHALHYAIQRAFGWQNGHLHHYTLPGPVFDELTCGSFAEWMKLAGVYFRFPTDDLEDIYWDDNYKEGESIRSWMRKKYTGPYRYKGNSEHYLYCQKEISELLDRLEVMTVHEYQPGIDIQKAPYEMKLKDASVKQVEQSFVDFFCHELIERLPLAQVLTIGEKKADLGSIRDEIFEKLGEIDIKKATTVYENKKLSDKARREFLDGYNLSAIPVSGELIYCYDYGDGWEVSIRCDALYEKDTVGNWSDDMGCEAHIYPEELEECIAKHRPICVAKDGIELVDDVGGPSGFCDMLKTIFDYERKDEKAQIESADMFGWANMLGWTGRNIGVKQTL